MRLGELCSLWLACLAWVVLAQQRHKKARLRDWLVVQHHDLPDEKEKRHYTESAAPVPSKKLEVEGV
jgi:hypothetical protein